ncbi:MAG: YfhO family protein, partial [Acidobacteria bacterium]|nr:YfhO family protein [Acidobacteriota bacterium]
MREEERERPVVDAADALTLDQDIDWDRCAREATPASHRTLRNLRAVANVLAGSRTQGDAADGESTASPGVTGSFFVRLIVRTLVAFAALWVAASLAVGLWGWDTFHREYGELAPFLLLLVGAPATTGCLFLYAGRRERRTWLLGAYFLLSAALVNPFALLGILRGAPPVEPFGYPDFAFPYIYPFMFAPAFLWAFARECPRVRRGTRLDDLARRMVTVSVLVGCVIWVGTVTWLVLARAGRVPLAVSWWMFDGIFVALNVLSLGAVVVVALRARTAPADETRRVVLFSIGFLMYVGLLAAYNLAEALSPGDWLSNYRWSPGIAVLQLLRFPGLFLLWYAVLAVRVPHMREVVRASLRRLLTRGWLLAIGAAVPAAVLVWLLANRPEEAVGAVAAEPLVQLLGAVAALSLLAAAVRRQLLVRLDAWLYPDTADQRQVLADATTALAKAGHITQVSRIVRRTARRGCGAPVSLLVRTDDAAETEDLNDPNGDIPPLARVSAIVHMLETVGGTLCVHPDDDTSYFSLLLDDDRRWVVD